MKSIVTWQDALRFEARTDASEHCLVIDSDSQAGPSPMELIISALGACSSIDVVMILEKGRHAVTGCRCELTGERAETAPRVYTHIHAHFIVEGEGLDDRPVERAVALSFEKYCSVALMINRSVEISHSFEVISG